MDMDLQRLQLKAVSDMLQLSSDEDAEYQHLKTWKVLIYDDEAKKLLSPILKVGELRSLGVTLNMSIGDKREPIPGVDAVYLITPKEENIAAIIADAKSKRYKQLHINFTSYTSDAFLSDLAKKFVEANAYNSIASVTDCYIHFASFALSTFSLNVPRCFKDLYGTQVESSADEVLDTLVDRLLSVVVTLGALPIIRAPRFMSPASAVAEKLNKKLHDLVSARHQLAMSLSSSFNRPMLVIMDRTVDLSSMLQHSWNYQPLLHDTFGISFDKVVLNSSTAGESSKKSTYDLEASDKIYQAINRLPLSDVATHIASALESYNSQIAQINKGDGEAAGSLVNAMNAIPHLTEQKRLLDMHTNLATALVDAVKDRDIDRFYEFEYDLDLLSEKACFQHFEELLASDKAHVMDLYRSLLLIALSRPNIPDSRLDELENRIKLRGDLQCEGLKGLRNVMKMKAFSESLMKQIQNAKTVDLSGRKAAEPSSQEPPKREFSQGHKKLAEYSSKIIDTGFNIFKGVKRLLPRKKNMYVVNILENLLNNSEAVSEEFGYYDPKASEHVLGSSMKKTPSRKCVLFIVGGGSYNESTMLQELAARTKHTILYGSTDFDRPEDFVMQLGGPNFME